MFFGWLEMECNLDVWFCSTSEIWNSMINPLLYFSLFGVLWYQGQSTDY